MSGLPKIAALSATLQVGGKSASFYALHRLRIRTGYYARRCPVGKWGERQAGIGVSPFGPPSKETLAALAPYRAKSIAAADRIKNGELLYFSTFWEMRPDWNIDPRTSFRFPADHWSSIPIPESKDADLKWVWEPSRFDWVFILGRAYTYTADESYAECFWTIFEEWAAANPPNTGINWWCGQECGLRAGALVWAAGIFSDSSTSTSNRLALLWEAVARLADRVEAALIYSISQHNNHMVSESLGIYLAGIALPNSAGSKRWKRIGRKLLEHAVRTLFLDDGAYIHSATNYTRAMLKLMTVAATAAAHEGKPFDPELVQRLQKAALLLHSMQDSDTGRVPNYGPNDGTNIYCLNSSEFGDFRPILQTVSFLCSSNRVFEAGPHDEELAWFFGTRGMELTLAPQTSSGYAARNGGYYVLRSESAFCMMRCHTHKEIPGHADMLHLDYWVNGRDVLCDGGSYSYSDARNWYQHFRLTPAHNTVVVDGQDQMRRFRRFLWADWTKSKLLEVSEGKMAGEHYGYRQLGLNTVHRREVHLRGRDLLVIDDLLNDSGVERQFELFWHLAQANDWVANGERGAVDCTGLHIAVFSVSQDKVEFLSGESFEPLTLRSLSYGDENPTAVLRVTARSASHVRWITVVSEQAPESAEEAVVWHGTRFPLAADVS